MKERIAEIRAENAARCDMSKEEYRSYLISHLVENQILYSDGTRLSFGDAGEEHYGRRHFMELVSVFTSDPVFKVLHGSQELGSVDQITFLRHREEEPAVLSMGGRSWLVTLLDWERREAFVVPAESEGKSQWKGGRIGMSWRFARAVHSLLASKSESNRWTSRTRSALTSLREQYGFLRPETDVVVTDRKRDELRRFTFAGGLVNTALADAMNAGGLGGASVSDFWIRASGTTDARHMVGTVRSLQLGEIHNSFKIAKDYLDNLKFSESLPSEIAHEIVRDRMFHNEEIKATIGREVVEVFTDGGQTCILEWTMPPSMCSLLKG
jgi:ATP-dependent helicase Lhr and Lhr-like helicase